MDNKSVNITLDIDRIVSIAIQSARYTADVVGVALQLIDDAGPEKVAALQSRHATYDFGLPSGSAVDRQEIRRQWLITKGFQDITLATRRACEAADVLLAIAGKHQVDTTIRQFNQLLESLRKRANKTNLPNLIKRIEDQIKSPLRYSKEMLSLNNARNCLEHRKGVVSIDDFDPDTESLSISYPRVKIFYNDGARDVEFEFPHHMPDAPDGTTFAAMMQIVERVIVYKIGDRISFDAHDFTEIAFAVGLFVNDLAVKISQSELLQAIPISSIINTGAPNATNS